MGYETVVDMNQSGDWATAKYVRYTTPKDEDGEERDLKPNELKLKKNESIEGYYLRSYTRDTAHGKKYNHVLVAKDNLHYVIPDNKDITKAFLSDRIVSGAMTRFTYLGKVKFEYTDDNGKTGSASAAKALIEQNKDELTTFEGNEGCEFIKGTKQLEKPIKISEPAFTESEVPF